jgi:hypothetical protein
MKHLATVSDKNFLIKGLTLYESLIAQSNDFILHYLLIDQEVYEKCKKLENENLKFYSASELIKKDTTLSLLKEKSYKYFCWSLASYFSNILLTEEKDSITYIDSDIFFNENINIIYQEIGTKEIALFRHRMFRLGYNHTEGLFNVGVVHFKNTEFGKKALLWWADAVLHQKHPGLDTCGDQKYLDYFFIYFKEKMFIDGNIGHGAPWHWQLYDLKNVKTRNEIVWENNVQKLIFNHFSQFKTDFENDSYIASTMHHCYTPLETYEKNENLKYIYDKYFNDLKIVKKKYNIT